MRRTTEKSAVILDRHPLWLDAMDKLLAEVGFDVVAQATDGDEALDLIDEHRPDVFIAGLDPAMGDEIACVRRAAQRQPALKSIVISDNADFEAIDAAFEAGASAYCVKTASHHDLASAIRQVFKRSIYLATNGTRGSSARTAMPVQSVAHDLTKREVEILQLVSEGHSNIGARPDAVGDRADGEVPPVEHLPEARRRQPHGGKPVGSAQRTPAELPSSGGRADSHHGGRLSARLSAAAEGTSDEKTGAARAEDRDRDLVAELALVPPDLDPGGRRTAAARLLVRAVPLGQLGTVRPHVLPVVVDERGDADERRRRQAGQGDEMWPTRCCLTHRGYSHHVSMYTLRRE